MTTCFAHLARGQWRAAARANPAGVLLACVCALLIPWMCLSAWRGETIGLADPVPALLILVMALAALTLMVWGLRFWR